MLALVCVGVVRLILRKDRVTPIPRAQRSSHASFTETHSPKRGPDRWSAPRAGVRAAAELPAPAQSRRPGWRLKDTCPWG